MNLQTKELPSIIDTFHDMHNHPTRGWVNTNAKDAYVSNFLSFVYICLLFNYIMYNCLVFKLQNALQQEVHTQSQSQSQSECEAGSANVNETQVVSKVLGQRRGHNRGIGRKLKGTSTFALGAIRSSSQSEASPFTSTRVDPPMVPAEVSSPWFNTSIKPL